MKTAVDWLIEEIEKQGFGYIKISIPKEIKHQAKTMQKEQAVKFAEGFLYDKRDITAKQYYKEKYATSEELE